MKNMTHYVNGEHVEGTSGRFSDIFNPATGDVQAQCPLASTAEVDAIIAKAAAAQPAWAAVNPQRPVPIGINRRSGCNHCEGSSGTTRMGSSEPATSGARDDEIRITT